MGPWCCYGAAVSPRCATVVALIAPGGHMGHPLDIMTSTTR